MGIFLIRALLLGAHIRAAEFWKLPCVMQDFYHQYCMSCRISIISTVHDSSSRSNGLFFGHLPDSAAVHTRPCSNPTQYKRLNNLQNHADV